MDKKNLAFDKVNFILLAAGMLIVVLGFILMSGSESTESAFDPNIFSAMRIKVAPIMCFVGFVSIIYAVIRKPKDSKTQE
ncbi:MAG: DUF3098 domain-containing protein [Prevotella sp.]|jgi:membrane protein|uniref:Signal peptide protein, YSIRK family n=1 Tax=Hoylesella saccharolytica F0055 TaxID=1127699 RepID=L1NFI5_9BACT|nr:DUF3098 domain-containing protein [Hoylesella saccharolytica]EKY02091.1 hypothetical protein HMPREF9151_00836 [Hoylesella saccharolytica F0055]RKW61302.1 MAG: DUF3098 domain-containing protein [Prevotella sp.]